jgi:hypothetical protein
MQNAAASPGQHRNRTSEVRVRQMSGYATNQDLALPLPDPIAGGKRISRQESTAFEVLLFGASMAKVRAIGRLTTSVLQISEPPLVSGPGCV